MNLLSNFAETITYTTTTTNSGMSGGLLATLWLVYLLVLIFLIIVPTWKIYNKAGKPGWASIVPVYNLWVLFEIVGYPGWWSLLAFIPFVNFFVVIMALVSYYKLAQLFGKGTGFAICTVLFPIVCIPILGYGSAQPEGKGSSNTNPPAPTPAAAPSV